MSKGPKALDVFDRELGRDWAEHASERQLLEIGTRVAQTDYAVCHYLEPWHPKFFGRRDLLVRAVRAGLARRVADTGILWAMESLRFPDKAGPSAAEAVMAGVEGLRTVLLNLDDDALDSLLTEIAYDPRDNVADWGDDFLTDWSYEPGDEEPGVLAPRIGRTREQLAEAGAADIMDLAQRISGHRDSVHMPQVAVGVATTWPLGHR